MKNTDYNSLAADMQKLFIVRSDKYKVQTKTGYKYGQGKLDREVVIKHLSGEITVASLCFDKNHNAITLCFDIDGTKEYLGYAHQIEKYLRDKYGIVSLFEKSGSDNSVHIWVFFEPQPAKLVREFGLHVLQKLNLSDIEIFPKATESKEGSVVKLPLGINRKNDRRSSFLNPQTNEELSLEDTTNPFSFMLVGGINNKVPTIKKTKQTHLDIGVPNPKDKNNFKYWGCKLKFCIQYVFNNKVQLEGSDGHMFRYHACWDMVCMRIPNSVIHEFFSIQKDYSYEITEKNIRDIIAKVKQASAEEHKKYHKLTSKCDTIKSSCSIVVKHSGLCKMHDVNKVDKKLAMQGISIAEISRINYACYDLYPVWKGLISGKTASKIGGKLCFQFTRDELQLQMNDCNVWGSVNDFVASAVSHRLLVIPNNNRLTVSNNGKSVYRFLSNSVTNFINKEKSIRMCIE